MKHYCYVVVRLDAMKCFTRVLAQSPANHEPARWDEATLQRLLQDGWQPAREVTLGKPGTVFARRWASGVVTS